MGRYQEHALRLIIILVIIGAGVGVKKILLNQKGQVKSEDQEAEVLVVKTAQASRVTQKALLQSNGNIVPAQSVSLVPEVRGKIVWVKPDFASGMRLKKGEIIAKIDARDIEAQLEQLRAQKEAAELEIQVEGRRQDFAKKEVELLGDLASDTSELQKRNPQLKAASLRLKAAIAQIELAEINLSRTELRAPFDALVIDESIDLGQVVGATPVATLIGSDAVQLRARIPMAIVKRLRTAKPETITATVIQKTADGEVYHWPARFMLVEASLDQQLRSATARFEIKSPFDGGPQDKQDGVERAALMPGSYVDIEIGYGEEQEWFRIAKSALRGDGSQIWVSRDGRIVEEHIELGFSDQTYAYFEPNDKLNDIIVTAPRLAQVGAAVTSNTELLKEENTQPVQPGEQAEQEHAQQEESFKDEAGDGK